MPKDAPARTGNRNALVLPCPNKRMTPRMTRRSRRMPDADRGNTFRKASRLVLVLSEVLASSTAATFNLGMQRTRESLLKFHSLCAAGRHRFSAPAFSAFLYKLGVIVVAFLSSLVLCVSKS